MKRTASVTAATAALVVGAATAAACIDRDPHPGSWGDYTTEVVSHRGDWYNSGILPNTPQAVQAAADAGADAVEIDVVSTSDDYQVVLHSSDLAKEGTTCTGDTTQMTYAAVRQCNLADGQQIPNLHEIMSVVRDTGLKIYIHDKTSGNSNMGWDYRYVLAKYGISRAGKYVLFRGTESVLDQYVGQGLSSVGFITTASDWYTKKYPTLLPYPASGWSKTYSEIAGSITTSDVREAQDRGKRVVLIAWEKNGTEMVDDYYRTGADGVMVDRLDYAVANNPGPQ